MNPNNLDPCKDTETARKRGAMGGASPKRKATFEAKRLMKKLLMSEPMLNDRTKAQLKNIGVDVDSDKELTTNAAILAATILQKAYSGDMDAIKMAFEMGGQAVTVKDQNDRERLKIERDKMKQLKDAGIITGSDIPTIIIKKPDNGD